MALIEPYIQNFHQLKGVTIGERRCSFNHYSKAVTSFITTPADVQRFFEGLKPLNRLEELFHLKLLLHYKQQDKLMHVLYNEDNNLIKLVLKNGTFFVDTFKNVETDKFMEFLANVSFVVRSKVITRLSKIPQVFENNKIDSYYFAVKEKYGLHNAKHLLSGCSLKTITDELTKHKILLTNNQLTRIYHRSNNFLEVYFAHLKKNNHDNFTNFAKIIKLVALENTDLYWRLLKEYEFDSSIKLSHKQTLVVLSKYKQEFLKDSTKYLPILNKYAIAPCLTHEEFKIFYANILPKTLDEFDASDFNDNANVTFYLFKFATKSKRFEILQDVFKTKYKSNILDHDEFFNELLLEMVPVQDRVNIIAKKLKNDPPEESYIAFYETDKAFEVIKRKISHTTDATKRLLYVEMLIKVCRVNRDMARWPEVLDYIMKRHKNEDNSFYSVIFRSIQSNCSLPKFDQNMWNTINNMIDAFKLRFKIQEYTLQIFQEEYMRFKVQSNLSIVEDLSEILEETYKDHSFYRFWNHAPMNKKCIDIIPEVIPKLFEGKKLSQAIKMYSNTVKEYNRKHKKRIDIFKYDFIVDYWESVIADDNSENNCIFEDLTFVRSRPELVKKITKLIWEGKRTDNYQWRWFLKYQPEDIIKHYEKFFEDKQFNRESLKNVPYNVTLFSHLGIPELFYKKSKELLETHIADLPGKSHQYIAAVKFLVHHKDFVEIIQPLLPLQSTTIDPSVKNDKNFVEVRQTIARVLSKYTKKSDILDTLAIIAKGDYLQFALFSMHKIMYHTAEYKLKRFLDKIADGSVSLRKHVIFILAGMSTVENVYETLQKIGQTERNSSVKSYLLKTTLQYFQLNPSIDFFELTKEHARLLEGANKEDYELLIDLKKTPMEFISSYIDFVWELIMESEDKDIVDLKLVLLRSLLGNVTEVIMEQIADDLLQKIVIKCLDFEAEELQVVYTFVYRYIIDRDIKDVGDRLSLVIKQFPKGDSDLAKARTCKNVTAFVVGFCKNIICIKNDKKAKKLVDVKLILTEFVKLSSNTSFNASNWINLTKMYLDTENYKKLTQNFKLFYTETVNKLSFFVIHILAEIFTGFISAIVDAEELKLQEILIDFLGDFLGDDYRIEKELFVTLVLPKSISKSEDISKKHLGIMKMLNKSKSDVVKTALSCYLESVTFDKKVDIVW